MAYQEQQTIDASYFHEASEDGPGRITIQYNGGRCILEMHGAEAERMIRAVEGKDSDAIRAILKTEIAGAGK